jgi:hypothetical protein
MLAASEGASCQHVGSDYAMLLARYTRELFRVRALCKQIESTLCKVTQSKRLLTNFCIAVQDDMHV